MTTEKFDTYTITVLDFAGGAVHITKSDFVTATLQIEDIEEYIEKVMKLNVSDCQFMYSIDTKIYTHDEEIELTDYSDDFLDCVVCEKPCNLDSEAFYPYGTVDEDNNYTDPDRADDVHCGDCCEKVKDQVTA